MNINPLNKTFDPQTLADDILEVRRIYTEFFAALDDTRWDKPVKGGSDEWTLHETVAHLCHLNNAGLESIKFALRGETYIFVGLETRYKLNAYNRNGINELMGIPRAELCGKLLKILSEAANIAGSLRPDQTELVVSMPIYNRPVKIVEALSIIMIHIGLFHTAQVAEPAGLTPLWKQLSPEIHHRVIGRTMRAFSLLYRLDIGGPLSDTIAFRVDGPGGGEWYVALSPDAPVSGEGFTEHPGLVIHMRETAVFSQMLTSRLNLPISMISGAMKLRGNLRLFLRMGTLFSVDARPPVSANARILPATQQQSGGLTK
jgi:hypothetical protein